MSLLHVPILQVTPGPVPVPTSTQQSSCGNVVTSGVVLAAATPSLIDIDTNTTQPKTKAKKNTEKALLLSDDEFQ